MGQCAQGSSKQISGQKHVDISIEGGATKVFKDIINEIEAFGESLQSLNGFWEQIANLSAKQRSAIGRVLFHELATLLKTYHLDISPLMKVDPNKFASKVFSAVLSAVEAFTQFEFDDILKYNDSNHKASIEKISELSSKVQKFAEMINSLERLGTYHLTQNISPQSFSLFTQAWHAAMHQFFKSQYDYYTQKECTTLLDIITKIMMKSDQWKVILHANMDPIKKLHTICQSNHTTITKISDFFQNCKNDIKTCTCNLNTCATCKKRIKFDLLFNQKLKEKSSNRFENILVDKINIDKYGKNYISKLSQFFTTFEILIDKDFQIRKSQQKRLSTTHIHSSDPHSNHGKRGSISQALQRGSQLLLKHGSGNSNNNNNDQINDIQLEFQSELGIYLQKLGTKAINIGLLPIIMHDCVDVLCNVLKELYKQEFDNKEFEKCIKISLKQCINVMLFNKTIINTHIDEMTAYIRNHANEIETALPFWENIIAMPNEEAFHFNESIIASFKMTAMGQLRKVLHKDALNIISDNSSFINSVTKMLTLIKNNEMQKLFWYLEDVRDVHTKYGVNTNIQKMILKSMDELLTSTFDHTYSWPVRKAVLTTITLCIHLQSDDYQFHDVIKPSEFETDSVTLIFLKLSTHFEKFTQFLKTAITDRDTQKTIIPRLKKDVSVGLQQVLKFKDRTSTTNEGDRDGSSSNSQVSSPKSSSGRKLRLSRKADNASQNNNHHDRQHYLQLLTKIANCFVDTVWTVLKRFDDPWQGHDVDGGNTIKYIQRIGRQVRELTTKTNLIENNHTFDSTVTNAVSMLMLDCMHRLFKAQFTLSLAESFTVILATVSHFLLGRPIDTVFSIIESDHTMKELRYHDAKLQSRGASASPRPGPIIAPMVATMASNASSKFEIIDEGKISVNHKALLAEK